MGGYIVPTSFRFLQQRGTIILNHVETIKRDSAMIIRSLFLLNLLLCIGLADLFDEKMAFYMWELNSLDACSQEEIDVYLIKKAIL